MNNRIGLDKLLFGYLKYGIPNNNFTNFLRIKIRKKKPPQFYVFPKQDSSQIKVLSDSDGIFIRKPFENEIPAGTKCKVLLFRNIFSGKI